MNAGALTWREVDVPLGHAIISHLDPEGRIVSVNADFVAISGYAEEEVVGEYLGAECHPDVPREVLEDRWRDLAAGRPWSGVLKNRCRNGDHYWVAEHVAPVFAYGRIVGYLALRRRALRERIAAADQLFRRLHEGPGTGLAVRHGAAARAGVFGRLRRGWRDRSLAARLWMILAPLAVLVTAVALIGGAALSRSAAALEVALETRQETAGERKAARDIAYQNRLQGARARVAMVLGVLVGAGVAVGGGIALTTALRRPLRQARRACAAMAEGNFDTRIDLGRDDEPGRLLQDLERLRILLACEARERRDEEHSGPVATPPLPARAEPGRRGPGADALRAGSERASDGALAARDALLRLGEGTPDLDALAFRTHILALNAVVAAARGGVDGRELEAFAAEATALDRLASGLAGELRGRLDDAQRSVEGTLRVLQEIGRAPGGTCEETPPPARADQEDGGRAWRDAPGTTPAGSAAVAAVPSPATPKSENISPSRPAPRPRRGGPVPKVKREGGARPGLDKEWEEL